MNEHNDNPDNGDSKFLSLSRQVLSLETALAGYERRLHHLESQMSALTSPASGATHPRFRFRTAVRKVLERVPGGRHVINLYAKTRQPGGIYSSTSLDLPLALNDLAAERSAVLFSQWHIAAYKAAHEEAQPEHLPAITISVVLYNASRWISDFTAAVLRSNYPLEKLHLVFVDNASTDSTADDVKNWMDATDHGLGSARLIRRRNDGYGSGNDAAISQAQTDFVLVTNVDTEFHPDMLKNLASTAVADDANVACWEAMQIPFEHPKYYDPITHLTNWSSHACILIRKTAYDACGGYEKRLFMYGEDVELSYRFRAQGWKLRYVPSARILHHTDIDKGVPRPRQLAGSLSAHVLLRHRYGNPVDGLVGEALIRTIAPTPDDAERTAGIVEAKRLIKKHRRYFRKTKQRGNAHFPFAGFDYDLTRDGAAFRRDFDPSKSDLPKVSIVTRTMPGRYWLLQQAMASVLSQTYPNIEHVIVEDRGTGASEIVQKVRKHYGADTKFQASTGHGRTATGNAGLAAATGDLLMFLDDDDLLFSDHVETLVDAILKNDTIAAYSLAWLVRTNIDREAAVYEEISHEVPHTHRLPFDRRRLLVENNIPIQAILFRREAYERLGGFHEDMDLLEDWNLWCRYSALGDFTFVEKLTSLYRAPASGDESAQRQKRFDESYEIVRSRNVEEALELRFQLERNSNFHVPETS